MKQNSSAYKKIAVVCCFAVCLGDFLVTSVLGFVHEHYNFLTQTESLLGTDDSPVAMYMKTWGIIFSLLFIMFAFSLYKTVLSKGFWQTVAVWLIIIYGLCESAICIA